MPVNAEMKDHVYKILELVGSSEKSIEDAIQNAITRASKTIRDMKWFEVVQTRGHIENGPLAITRSTCAWDLRWKGNRGEPSKAAPRDQRQSIGRPIIAVSSFTRRSDIWPVTGSLRSRSNLEIAVWVSAPMVPVGFNWP